MKYVIQLNSDYAKWYFCDKRYELEFEVKDYTEIDMHLSNFEKRNNFFMHSYTLIEVK